MTPSSCTVSVCYLEFCILRILISILDEKNTVPVGPLELYYLFAERKPMVNWNYITCLFSEKPWFRISLLNEKIMQYLIPDDWVFLMRKITVSQLELQYLFVERETTTVGLLKLQYLIPDVSSWREITERANNFSICTLAVQIVKYWGYRMSLLDEKN